MSKSQKPKNKPTTNKTAVRAKASRFVTKRLTNKDNTGTDSTVNSEVPRITNETVEQHRREVIDGGRKFLYPIINTPRRILGVSLTVALAATLIFGSYTLLRLYRFNDRSQFIYSVTKVIPLPVVRVGGEFIQYEDYLYELRRSLNYFTTQQGVDFSEKAAQTELQTQQENALRRVIDNAYIRRLARQNNVTVSDAELDAVVAELGATNGLVDVNSSLEEVIQEFWGTSLEEYRNINIRNEVLRQKVAEALDEDAYDKAEQALRRIASGEDFTVVASELSEDPVTSGTGGEYVFLLDRATNNLDQKILDAAYATEIGGTTGVINVGYSLEIIKVLENIDGQLRAAHISLNFDPVDEVIKELKEEQPARVFINVGNLELPEIDPSSFEQQ